MKHIESYMKSLVSVALCFIMAMAFASCSKDDDEPDSNDLGKIIVGTWAQDGDNDILTINANGTGVGYDNPTAYQNNQVGYSFNWSYKDGWVTVTSQGEEVESMRAKSVSQNKIVWQRYDKEATSGEGYEKDAFGYYELWTWERYTK